MIKEKTLILTVVLLFSFLLLPGCQWIALEDATPEDVSMEEPVVSEDVEVTPLEEHVASEDVEEEVPRFFQFSECIPEDKAEW